MKILRMAGIVGVAVGALSAYGVPAANANDVHFVLCQQPELACNIPVPDPTTIVAHSVEPWFITSLGTVKCNKSLIEITMLNLLSTLGLGHLLASSFEGCSLGKTACTVTVESLGLVSFTKIGALEASMKSTGGKSIHIVCGSLINCKYGGEPLLKIHSTAGGLTQILATETTILKEEGEKFICPDESKWVATYDVLGEMWVES